MDKKSIVIISFTTLGFLAFFIVVSSLVPGAAETLDVDLSFARTVTIAYENTEGEKKVASITDADDVQFLAALFSGQALLHDEDTFLCGHGPDTLFCFIGEEEAYTIILEVHGGLVPESYRGFLYDSGYEENEDFYQLILTYAHDISTEPEWLHFSEDRP